MSDLPNSWVLTTIGEVVETKVAQRIPLSNENFFYIDISSIDRNSKQIVNPQKLTGDKAPSRARQVIASGDVLVSMTRPNLNAVAIVSEDLDGQIASTGFDVLRAIDIDPRWLYYLVRSNDFVTAMSNLVQGALYPAVRPRDIRNFEFLIAPLNEQRRITKKLDSLLARVDSCQSHLERIPQILKRFRRSVLAAAMDGRLLEIENEGNGDELPSGWQYTKLDQISAKITDGEHIRPKTTETGVFFLSAKDVRENGVTFDNPLYVSQKDADKYRLRCNPEFGDILVVSRGATVGRTCLVSTHEVFCLLGSVILVKPNKQVNGKYLSYAMKSPKVQKQLIGLSGSTAQGAIYLKDIRNTFIPLPPLFEQAEIVRRAEKLFAYADRLEARYLSATQRVEQLIPSLLAKAFRGELVEQDAEDEPVSELLERIKQKELSKQEKVNGRKLIKR